jgi:membrane protease YdiL (CAAX protease family)
MEDVIFVSDPDVPPEPPMAPKGRPLLAWGFIILMAGGISWLQSIRTEERSVKTQDRAGLLMMQMQGRLLVGIARLLPVPSNQSPVESLNTGSVSHRLRAIILEGELAGPRRAQELLNDLEEKIHSNHVEVGDTDKSLQQILTRLYNDYVNEEFDAPSLTHSQKEILRKELGWFGDLALAPVQGSNLGAREQVLAPAQRTAIIMIAVGGLGLLTAAAGLFGMIFLVAFFYAGQVRRGLGGAIRHGGLYAETFAVWMAFFLALQFLVGIFAVEKYRFLLLGLAMLLSLGALAWPVFRGVPWSQVREDIGFTNGRWPILEPLFGLAGYAMTLPMLLIAVLIMNGLMGIRARLTPSSPGDNFGPINQPSHPIVEYLMTGNWLSIIQIVVVASLLAPIVEETMFRGVLYRHLREASARLGVTMSVILSGTVVSFVFAVIHPQGWLAVPPLMALAFGFTLLREWRGTLIPSMVAHGINNGLLTVVLILAMG